MSKNRIIVIIATVVLCYAGFNNKFPLLTEDTGALIRAGFTHKPFYNDGFLYGLFIAHASWGVSLWLVIFCQGFMAAVILYFYFRNFAANSGYVYYYLAFILSSAFLLSGSITVSTIDPGIFSVLAVLSGGLMLFAHDLKRRDLYVVSFLLFLSVVMSLSSLVLASLLALVFAALLSLRKKLDFSVGRLVVTLSIAGMGWLTVSAVNLLAAGSFSPVANVEVAALPRLTTAGFTQIYLETAPQAKDTQLYVYKDSLDRLFSHQSVFKEPFLSPEQKKEYARATQQIVHQPGFLVNFSTVALADIGNELTSVSSNKRLTLENSVMTLRSIFEWYNEDVREVYISRQLNNNMELSYLNLSQAIVIVIAIICFILLILYKKSGIHLGLSVWLVASCLAYAFINGTLYGVGMYQYHIVWLLVLPLFLWLPKADIPNFVQQVFEQLVNPKKKSTL